MEPVTVFVGVTAYRESDALNKLIESLQCQTFPAAKLIIIDNSPESLLPALEAKWGVLSPFFEYSHHPENPGLGWALAHMLTQAQSAGADFLWLFDQDSEPFPNALEELIAFWQNLLPLEQAHVGVLASLPVHVSEANEIHGLMWTPHGLAAFSPPSGKFYKCDAVITAGMLVVMRNVGSVRPRADFFLDMVDYDFCLQMRDCNKEIVVVRASRLRHRMGLPKRVLLPILHTSIFVPNYSPLRWYYYCRNLTFLEWQRSSSPLWCLMHRFAFLRTPFKDALLSAQGLRKIYAACLGTLHGLLGNLKKKW